MKRETLRPASTIDAKKHRSQSTKAYTTKPPDQHIGARSRISTHLTMQFYGETLPAHHINNLVIQDLPMNDTQPDNATPSEALPAEESVSVPRYAPRKRTLFRILFVNLLLSVCTLGIYRFWGKTRLRRYIWSRIRFRDEPLEYSGTGMELFVGFLIVLAVLVPLLIIRSVVELYFFDFENPAEALSAVTIVNLAVVLIFYMLIQVAIYRARRYRLSRTRWRGIIGAQTGTARRYAALAMGYFALTAVTLGICFPFMSTALQRYRTDNTWLGDNKMEFSGRARDLMKPWLLCWLLWIPTLGLAAIWYFTREIRYFAGKTALGSIRFASTITGGGVLWIYFRFLLIVSGLVLSILAVATIAGFMFDGGGIDLQALFGGTSDTVPAISISHIFMIVLAFVLFIFGGILGTIFITSALLELFCKTLQVIGPVDYDTLLQGDHPALKRGEGLADALDIGGL